MSNLQLPVDVSCIKKENEKFEEEQFNNHRVKCIKTEEAATDKLWTEVDIGPIKIEETVYNNIKEELVDALDNESACKVPETSAKSTKSHNRRELVRGFHQRILQLDKNKSQAWSHQSSRISNAEHMAELRQRLINLEQPINLPGNDHAKPSSQLRRELEQRLMDVDSVHRKKLQCHRQSMAKVKLHSETAAAQRMRTLRQRRRDLQNSKSNCNSSSTAPQLSVNRMQEFRQRLLNATKVAVATKTQKQIKRSKLKQTMEGTKKLSKTGT
ncbi:hypothetical protein KR044_012333 [Drosophila immigrans]|nr:hypothetical protein KR044_012333 [Drosophila immigrans]